MPTPNLFEQDAQPTARVTGDLWITSDGAVYMCTKASTNVWTLLSPTPPSTSAPRVRVLTDTATRASFTDGGSTVGTRVMAGYLPVGAVVLGTKVLVGAGFIGDTSAAMTIGDGSDVDRYNTSTIDVFTTAADGVQSGIPSGTKLITTANSPTLTITSGADFTNVTAGSVTVSIFYLL